MSTISCNLLNIIKSECEKQNVVWIQYGCTCSWLFALMVTGLTGSRGLLLLPSIMREHCTTWQEPRRRSKFQIGGIVYTECILLLHYHRVENCKSNCYKWRIIYTSLLAATIANPILILILFGKYFLIFTEIMW